MSNMIDTDYGKKEMNRPTAGRRTAGQQTQAAISFLGLAARNEASIGTDVTAVGTASGMNTADLSRTFGVDITTPGTASAMSAALASIEAYRSLMVSSSSGIRAEEAAPAQPATLEEMLKERYPGIKYHVFDASTNCWKTRNDYPHYLLYQDRIDTDALENWKPSGPNPPYTPFQASKEIRALGAVPPGSKAVVIHPKVQARMEQDPEYAQEIMTRIETWFTFDVLRNEAILPGCTAGMSQAVAIGEDGCIVNAVSSGQPRLTRSSSDTEDWWDIRKARHAYYMSLITEKQLEHRLLMGGLAEYQSSQAAKEQLAELMKGSRLLDIFGPTLGGVSTESVLEHTKKLVWGDGHR